MLLEDGDPSDALGHLAEEYLDIVVARLQGARRGELGMGPRRSTSIGDSGKEGDRFDRATPLHQAGSHRRPGIHELGEDADDQGPRLLEPLRSATEESTARIDGEADVDGGDPGGLRDLGGHRRGGRVEPWFVGRGTVAAGAGGDQQGERGKDASSHLNPDPSQ